MTSTDDLLTPPPSQKPMTAADFRFEIMHASTEWIEAYRPGGDHPVHIGDVHHEGRYQVIKKLGYGSFSTVWLAYDTRSV